jgi:RsiW-degrading membrane proteinase PrsW (M82 family)
MSDSIQRFVVFGIELALTYGLIAWMRLSQRGGRESWSFILKILGLGMVAAMVSAYVQLRYTFKLPQLGAIDPLLVSKYGTWLELLNGLSVALIEELGKYMIGVFSLLSTKHVHKMSDTVLYLVIVGLGFALIEDAIFLLNPDTVPVLRLMSFYLHAGTSAIIGYSLGRYKFGLAGYKELLISVGAAVGLHFAFNLTTVIANTNVSTILSFAIAFFISLQIFILFRRILLEEYGLELRAKRLRHTTLLNMGQTMRVAE